MGDKQTKEMPPASGGSDASVRRAYQFSEQLFVGYLRQRAIPENAVMPYLQGAKDFLSTFPEAPIDLLGPPQRTIFLKKAKERGAGEQELENLAMICDVTIDFVRDKMAASPGEPPPPGGQPASSTTEGAPGRIKVPDAPVDTGRRQRLWIYTGLVVGIVAVGLFLMDMGKKPPEGVSKEALQRGVSGLRRMSENLRRSMFSAVFPQGTPGQWVSYVFSSPGLAERVGLLPQGVSLKVNEPDRLGRAQIVLSYDDEARTITARAFSKGDLPPAVRETWSFPEIPKPLPKIEARAKKQVAAGRRFQSFEAPGVSTEEEEQAEEDDDETTDQGDPAEEDEENEADDERADDEPADDDVDEDEDEDSSE